MSAVEPKKKNNRAFPRRTAQPKVKVTCRTDEAGSNVAAAVLDVSEEGVRLLVKGPLNVGQHVIIGLEGSLHKEPVVRRGKVIWSAKVTDGGYCVGICLESSLADDDVRHVC